MASGFFGKAGEQLAKGNLAWDNGGQVYKCALVGTGYTFDPDHNFVNQLTNELSGGNYSRKTLTSRTVTKNDANNRIELDAADPTFAALNAGTFRGVVVYKEVTNDADSPLVAYLQVPDVATNGGDITIQFPAQGLGNLTY